MNFTFPIRVYYEDTDAGGIVYYANYLAFAERARTEWLRSLGITQQTLWEQDNIGFVVKQCSIDYHAPARLDDQLIVSVEIVKKRQAGLMIAQQITHMPDACLIASVNVTIVCVNGSLKPIKLPHNLLSHIEVAL